MMPDPLKYTEEELVKELVLLEKHLKQSPYMDENFCIDCIEKHLISAEGLAEEGIGFADSKEKEKMFINIANQANRLKREIKTNPDFAEMSRGVREIRKSLNNCPTCNFNPHSSNKQQQELLMPVSDIESLTGFRRIAHHGDEEQYYDLHFANDEFYISDEGVIIWRSSDNFPKLARKKWKELTDEDLPKDLYRSLSINQNNSNNLNKKTKRGISMKLKEVGIINAGAFLGKGVQVLADYVDTKSTTVDPQWYQKASTYINIGGGLALQMLALYGIKNDNMKLLTTVAGANMVTKSVDIAKEALTPAPAVAARAQAVRAPLRVTRAAPAIAPITPRGNGLVIVD